MERFFLELPTIDRKEEALEYLNEHRVYNSPINGTGGMDKCMDGLTYEEWLLEIDKRKNMEYLKKINRCRSKTYFMIRENDNKIVGMTNIRYDIPMERLQDGLSHIGYGIRPTERKKGYAKLILFMGLLEEQKLGEKKILLDCSINNIASKKTIESLGGILIKDNLEGLYKEEDNRYWINVNDSINKYGQKYMQHVKGSQINQKNIG